MKNVPRTAALPALCQALLLAALLVVFTLNVRLVSFACDDAFISMRYAGNLARHGELVFNPGQRVEGYSNFLWTLLLAGWMKATGADPVPFALGAGWLFGALGIVVTWRAARRRVAPEGAPPAGWGQAAAPLVAPAILALSAPWACWSSGGLETQLFAFLVSSALFLFIAEEQRPDAGPDAGPAGRPRLLPPARWSSVLFALAAMTRPEGFACFLAALLWRAARDLRAGKDPAAGVKAMWPFALLALPWLAWKLRYYGNLLPNTYFAKEGGAALAARGLRDLLRFLGDSYAWLLLPLPALALLARRRGARTPAGVGLLAAVCIGAAAYDVWAGGDFMEMGRLLVPALPCLALLCQDGIVAACAGAAGRRRAAAAAAAALVVAFLALHGMLGLRAARATLAVRSRDGTDSIGYLALASRQWRAVGEWLRRDAAGRDAVVATGAAGAIPFYSGLRTLDMLGLSDPYVARLPGGGSSRPGHTHGTDWHYLALWRPDYFIGHPRIDREPPPPPEGDRALMEGWGYRWKVVAVEGLEPPYLGFWKLGNRE